jgi:hypothetical protein
MRASHNRDGRLSLATRREEWPGDGRGSIVIGATSVSGVEWGSQEREGANARFRENPKKVDGAASPTGQPPRMAPVYRSTFADLSPIAGRDYFGKLAEEERTHHELGRPAGTIGICIPCYNEEEAGLRNTLASLAALEVPKGFKLNIIILMDGVKPGVPAASTRAFLTQLYGIDWAEFDGDTTGALLQTTIYESLHWYQPGFTAPATEKPGACLCEIFGEREGGADVDREGGRREDLRVRSPAGKRLNP